MGCCSSNPSSKYKHQSYPPDLKPDQSLEFKVALKNFKLKGITEKISIKLTISVGSQNKFETQYYMTGGQTIRWNEEFNFNYIISLENLYNDSMKILISSENKILNEIKISILDVLHGPSHFDYLIKKKNAAIGNGRIIFDAKFSQKLELKIKSKRMKFSLKESLNGMHYNFDLKLKDGIHSYESSYSKDYINPIFYSKRTSTENLIIAKQPKTDEKSVLWELETANSPKIETFVYAASLGSVCLIVNLWKQQESTDVDEENIDNSYVHKNIDSQLEIVKSLLEGQTYFNFGKFYSDDIVHREVNKKNYFVYAPGLIQNESKLWSHGYEVGRLEYQLIIESQPFLKQMICGVRSEDGISKNTFFLKDLPKILENKRQYQFKQLLYSTEKIAELLVNLQKITEKKGRWGIESNIYEEFTKCKEILSLSDKATVKCFLYHTPNDLLNAQQMFINIGFVFIESWEIIPDSSIEIFFDILELLIYREELDLSSIGFSQVSFISIQNEKTITAKQYDNFLYGMLKKILKFFDTDDKNSAGKRFLFHFLSQSYFRIPAFRNYLLHIIYNKEDNIIVDEWRGTEWDLNTDNSPELRDNQYIVLFDWIKNFYLHIDKDINKHYEKYNLLFSEFPFFFNRIKKKSSTFNFFLMELCTYIKKMIIVTGGVPWELIPGYKILLKVFLNKIKKKSTIKYTESTKRASCALLHFSSLINLFYTILYHKTNLHDTNEIFQAFDLINTWLNFMRLNQISIPTNFDYNFFLKGIFLVLDQEHCFCCAKVLWLLYNAFDLFSNEFKYEIIDHLLTDLFVKLFLHWCYYVRKIFHYFICFRMLPFFFITKNKNEINQKNLTAVLKLIGSETDGPKKFMLQVYLCELEFENFITSLEAARVEFDAERTSGAKEDKNKSNIRKKIEKLKKKSPQRKSADGTLLPSKLSPIKVKPFESNPEALENIMKLNKSPSESKHLTQVMLKNKIMENKPNRKIFTIPSYVKQYSMISMQEYKTVEQEYKYWKEKKNLKNANNTESLIELFNENLPNIPIEIPLDDKESIVNIITDRQIECQEMIQKNQQETNQINFIYIYIFFDFKEL